MFGVIRRIYKDQNEFKIVLKLSSFFLVAFLLYLVANYFILYTLSINDIKSYLQKASVNLVSDFDYKNGQWNTEKYLSDVNSPTENPVYIFSIDGFLMDRLKVIHGFLDTSNFEYASSFSTPKTFISPIGESWRAYSYPVKRDGQDKAAILVAYFEPKGVSDKEVDDLLRQSALQIDAQIRLKDGIVDISGVRLKEIDSNVSVEIVDTFNRSLVSNGGPPAFIDKSYIQDALSLSGYRTITDNKTNAKYLIYTQPIVSNNQTAGLVIVGNGLSELRKTLSYQFWFSVAVGLIVIIIFILLVVYLYRHDISEMVQDRLTFITNPSPIEIKRISFDEDKSNIVINGSIVISIPKDSHQFDVCRLLFRVPNKPKDTIDLSDAIDNKKESKDEVRMVYDAIFAINVKTRKRIGIKLISHENKQYFINPILAPKIHN